MKTSIFIVGVLVAAALFTLTSCQEEITTPADLNTSLSKDGSLIDADTGSGDNNPNFVAVLAGRNEVPMRVSRGHGVAKMHINPAHDSIFYWLNVSNLDNVVAAHIHRGSPGNNGPVVAELYTAAPAGGRTNGRLTEGVFTPADLVGPYSGSSDFNLFIEELHLDSLYVNVHTDDGNDPPNTGTGDYASGEIRGQLRSAPYGGIGVKPKDQ